MPGPLITLNEYLHKGQIFVIPHYQRGYIWGKSRGTEKNSVRYFIESIVNCYKNDTELFLQGITVTHNASGQIEIIDGQQRTTALYLLLIYLGYPNTFRLSYAVRTKSDAFLISLREKSREEIITMCAEEQEEEYQDIFYFKKTIREIDDTLRSHDKDHLLTFLTGKSRIKFLYIEIPNEKAVTVFTMMNGNKAQMQTGEIIKAELLRLISTADRSMEELPEKEREARRWDENTTRSKYAREWDKWQAWWNKPDVKDFYDTDAVSGLLPETYFHARFPKEDYNFDNFRDKILRGDNNRLCAKNTFYGLRHLQKRFEDVFNNPDSHNKIGAILTIFDKNDKQKFIRTFFAEENGIDVEHIYKYVYTKLSFTAIINNDEKIDEIKAELMKILDSDDLYHENPFHASAQLFRRNVEADTKLGRPFDFRIWKEKSLEHIEPQSQNGSNGIGNLVLLYKNENSGFGARPFSDKKRMYFDLMAKKPLRSRHLLHSISVFANDVWNDEQIERNKREILTEIKEYYGIQ